jgi:ribonuclease Z
LQEGFSVTNPKGQLIESKQVCGPNRPGRHLVLLGDTCDSSAIAQAARGCDVLVHEVTYDAAREDKARLWGHSTTAMAGRFAQQVGAKNLIITHFSSRFDEQSTPSIEGLVQETRSLCPDTAVFPALDYWSFDVPVPN